MRSSNKSRSRNKNNNSNRRNVGNVVNRVFDSAGPEGRVRGTPAQVIEKYQGLARDAQLSGDRVAAENFQQHAEHYNRVLGEALLQQSERAQQQAAQNEAQRQQQQNQAPHNGAEANAASGSGMTTVGEQAPEAHDGGLVETPENAPKQAHGRGPRRPRGAKDASAPSGSAPSPDLDTAAE
jgi:Domain of unknown function (DUF4167)